MFAVSFNKINNIFFKADRGRSDTKWEREFKS